MVSVHAKRAPFPCDAIRVNHGICLVHLAWYLTVYLIRACLVHGTRYHWLRIDVIVWTNPSLSEFPSKNGFDSKCCQQMPTLQSSDGFIFGQTEDFARSSNRRIDQRLKVCMEMKRIVSIHPTVSQPWKLDRTEISDGHKSRSFNLWGLSRRVPALAPLSCEQNAKIPSERPFIACDTSSCVSVVGRDGAFLVKSTTNGKKRRWHCQKFSIVPLCSFNIISRVRFCNSKERHCIVTLTLYVFLTKEQ